MADSCKIEVEETYAKIDGALGALGLADKYGAKFRAEQLTDGLVDYMVLSNSDSTSELRSMFGSLGDYMRFVKEYRDREQASNSDINAQLQLQTPVADDSEHVAKKFKPETERAPKSKGEKAAMRIEMRGLHSRLVHLFKQRMLRVVSITAIDTTREAYLRSVNEIIGENPVLDEESKMACLVKLKEHLNAQKSQTLRDVRKRKEKFESSLNVALKEALEVYRLMSSEPTYPRHVTTFTKNHEEAKNQANLKFGTIMKSLEKDYDVLEETASEWNNRLEAGIISLLSENDLANKNSEKKLNSDMRLIVNQNKDDYISKLEEICENAKTISDFNMMEAILKKKLLNKLLIAVQQRTKDQMLEEEVISNLTKEFDTDRDEHFQVFCARLNADESVLKTVLFEAKQWYAILMDKKLGKLDWLEKQELDAIHTEVLRDVITERKKAVSLSAVQEEMLKESLMSLYQKYKEENDRREPNKDPAIGIDLGTTYSCVAVYHNGKVEIIRDVNVDNKTTIPSYLAFKDDGSIEVGSNAKEAAFRNPSNTIYDAKRLIGRKFDDESVQKDRKLWPFDVINFDGQPRIHAKGVDFRPEEISAKVLYRLKELATEFLGRKVTKGIVTVPAYFGNSQRQATKDAAEIAGLEVTILNEPTAAAIAYQLHRTGDLRRHVLIFDLGGGTFDVAVLDIERGSIDVKAVGGDTHLGGEDFDNAMVDALVKRVKANHDVDLLHGLNSQNYSERLKAKGRLRRLKTACEEKKKALSTAESVDIYIEMLDNNFSLEEKFSRKEFNDLNMKLFNKCIDCVRETLNEAKIKKEEIDDIVLVGGSSRIPKVQEMLKNFFGGKKLNKSINGDEAVATGAAYQAALLHSEGCELNETVLTDVTPLSLGVETFDSDKSKVGKMSVIIPKNTRIPCKRRTQYGTLTDNQIEITVNIYEGEGEEVRLNTELGSFDLKGIPPAPAGAEPIIVRMRINAEGILLVEAEVRANGRKSSLTVTAYDGRMSLEERKQAKLERLLRWN